MQTRKRLRAAPRPTQRFLLMSTTYDMNLAGRWARLHVFCVFGRFSEGSRFSGGGRFLSFRLRGCCIRPCATVRFQELAHKIGACVLSARGTIGNPAGFAQLSLTGIVPWAPLDVVSTRSSTASLTLLIELLEPAAPEREWSCRMGRFARMLLSWLSEPAGLGPMPHHYCWPPVPPAHRHHHFLPAQACPTACTTQ
jgi:hypothetical protein